MPSLSLFNRAAIDRKIGGVRRCIGRVVEQNSAGPSREIPVLIKISWQAAQTKEQVLAQTRTYTRVLSWQL